MDVSVEGVESSSLVVSKGDVEDGLLQFSVLDSELPVDVLLSLPGFQDSFVSLNRPASSSERTVGLEPLSLRAIDNGGQVIQVRLKDGPALTSLPILLRSDLANQTIEANTDENGNIVVSVESAQDLEVYANFESTWRSPLALNDDERGYGYSFNAAILYLDVTGNELNSEVMVSVVEDKGANSESHGRADGALNGTWFRRENTVSTIPVLISPRRKYHVQVSGVIDSGSGSCAIGSISIGPVEVGEVVTRAIPLKKCPTSQFSVPRFDEMEKSEYRLINLDSRLEIKTPHGDRRLLTDESYRLSPGVYKASFYPIEDSSLVPMEPFLDFRVEEGKALTLNPRLGAPARLEVSLPCTSLTPAPGRHTYGLSIQTAGVRPLGVGVHWTRVDKGGHGDKGQGLRCGGVYRSSCLPPTDLVLSPSQGGRTMEPIAVQGNPGNLIEVDVSSPAPR
ncbi:MAG: hypothetical protein KUG81_10630 [Gammaproteobacteria bacterium]|nr:hypothetical protein [Gammaproteobacteria bacterium]